MIKSDKKLNNLAATLKNENPVLITSAIDLLRDEQPFEGAIGLLTSYYDKTEESQVRKAIEEFMNDLKDQSACVEVITEIRKHLKPETTSMLVSSCWQSGLNYSEFSTDLAEVFLTGDYITAMECLTVIEESVQELSNDKKKEIINLIEASPLSPASGKNTLARELISILGG